jgi:hypothetical protein
VSRIRTGHSIEPLQELFNIAKDPTGLHDLSASEPEPLIELRALWDQYRVSDGVV